MDGIGRRMPWTMGSFAVGALSMIGVPPTAGFLGKWFILLGAVAVGQWFAVAVIVVSTLLNAGYFLPIVYRAFARARRRKAVRTRRHGDRRGALADGGGAGDDGDRDGRAVLLSRRAAAARRDADIRVG